MALNKIISEKIKEKARGDAGLEKFLLDFLRELERGAKPKTAFDRIIKKYKNRA